MSMEEEIKELKEKVAKLEEEVKLLRDNVIYQADLKFVIAFIPALVVIGVMIYAYIKIFLRFL